jgi:hypothetical protein
MRIAQRWTWPVLFLVAACSQAPVASTPDASASEASAPAASAPAAPSTPAPDPPAEARNEPVMCTNPRPQICTAIYLPVCATVDTGVRCVTTPCPSTELKTMASDCSACSDAKVISYVKGECPAK